MSELAQAKEKDTDRQIEIKIITMIIKKNQMKVPLGLS